MGAKPPCGHGRQFGQLMKQGFAGTLLASFLLLAGPDALAQNNGNENSRIASLQAQILELQEQMRALTGRLEELEYANRQTGGRIDQLIGDVDLRLRAMEDAPLENAAIGDTPDEVTIVRPEPTAVPLQTQRQPVEPAQSGSAQNGKILGTIPRDALLGLERPGGSSSTQNQAATAPAASGDNAQTRYDAILSLLSGSDITAATPALEQFIADFPESPQVAEASYMLGETWFLGESYADAAARFAENYRQFGPDDARAADNLLKLGMSLGRLGDPERACTAFIEFERRYPDANTALKQAAARERGIFDCS